MGVRKLYVRFTGSPKYEFLDGKHVATWWESGDHRVIEWSLEDMEKNPDIFIDISKELTIKNQINKLLK